MIWGESWHIFKPDNLKPDDEAYPLQVLIKQANFFWTLPSELPGNCGRRETGYPDGRHGLYPEE